MNLEHLNQLVARIDYVESTGSTNTDLAEAAVLSSAGYPDLSVLCAGSQSSGRGRAGRVWESAAGASLSLSILVRPKGVSLGAFGWLPVLAGLAASRFVTGVLPGGEVGLKWPNDVLVGDKKIC